MALSPLDRRILRLFACVALGRFDELAELRRTAPAGEPDRAWREAVLQAHLFAGFPRAVEAYGVLEAAGGLGALEPGEARGEPDQRSRGRELFERIYREDSARIRALLVSGHPDFAEWIEGHAYGRVLSRPGLGADRRELLAVAGLAVLGQERQLASHVRGAVRCGASRSEVAETLELVADLVPSERMERTRAVVSLYSTPDE